MLSPTPGGSFPPLPCVIPKTLGARLAARRNDCQITQSELANEVCVILTLQLIEEDNVSEIEGLEALLIEFAVRLDVSILYLREGIT